MPLACATVYDEILTWSKSRPDWQRDALRRLIIAGSLEPKDIDELILLCKTSFGLADSSQHKLVPIPLDESHICHDAVSGKSVCLTAISDVSNVNAIISPTPLSFNESGITLIYGDNGAGKSGYVRILKSVCRSRKTEPRILQNVFTGDEGQVPSATISFKLGGADGTFPWEKGKQGAADLTCINVFDSGCASVYVNEDNRIVYMPLGLDIFDTLAKACDAIKASLQAEKDKIVSSLDRLPFAYQDTAVGKWYASLKLDTPPEEVVKNTSSSEKEAKRLTELHLALFEDSKKKRAAELRMKMERYGRLLARVTAVKGSLSEEAVEKLKGAKVSFEIASKVAELASNEAFGKEKLKGIGSDPWREMWEAAKRFSENEAYPGKEFPYTEPDSKCVLCLQDLKPEAAERMKRFRKFVQDEAASKEARTRLAYENEKKAFGIIEVSEHGDETLLKELKEDNKALGESVSEYFEAARGRKAAALKACNDGTWEQITDFSDFSLEEQLEDFCADLRFSAEILDEADDPELLPKLQAEFNELSARKWVSERKTSIEEEITRQLVVKLYEAAISDTHTAQITKTSTTLTDKYVTEELKARFIQQLKAIYQNDLKVSLEKKQGEKGVTYYYIRLKDSMIPKANVTEVISEGEFHAVALAAFLAEISLSPTKSGIVFDDPVSSLDHEIRENLARQLVELAKDRQVIVFTHDLFFFVAIREIGKKEHVPVIERHVAKDYTGPGMCYPEAPWDALEVSKRITELKKLMREVEQKYKQGLPEYEKIAGFVCLRIRKTVERTVEEILLCDIVHRYRRNLYTQNVRKLEKMRIEDLKFLDSLMTRYSVEVHDQAEESKSKLPTPEKLKEDVLSLDKWIKEYRER
jgi:energy-coupling factor transporter ATP-binding protein EcfA2